VVLSGAGAGSGRRMTVSRARIESTLKLGSAARGFAVDVPGAD